MYILRSMYAHDDLCIMPPFHFHPPLLITGYLCTVVIPCLLHPVITLWRFAINVGENRVYRHAESIIPYEARGTFFFMSGIQQRQQYNTRYLSYLRRHLRKVQRYACRTSGLKHPGNKKKTTENKYNPLPHQQASTYMEVDGQHVLYQIRWREIPRAPYHCLAQQGKRAGVVTSEADIRNYYQHAYKYI